MYQLLVDINKDILYFFGIIILLVVDHYLTTLTRETFSVTNFSKTTKNFFLIIVTFYFSFTYHNRN